MLPQAGFKCPSDGHFPNPESCASYYHCANGHVSENLAATTVLSV